MIDGRTLGWGSRSAQGTGLFQPSHSSSSPSALRYSPLKQTSLGFMPGGSWPGQCSEPLENKEAKLETLGQAAGAWPQSSPWC